jgi:hypothetical protein
VAGALSDGFRTMVLPSASAGTMWPLGRWAGKLNGPSTAITPWGLNQDLPCLVGVMANSTPVTRASAPEGVASSVMSTLLVSAETSPLLSHMALPVSSQMRSAICWARAETRALNRWRTAKRRSRVQPDQTGSAARAAATASWRCGTLEAELNTACAGRAGLKDRTESPGMGIHRPLMRLDGSRESDGCFMRFPSPDLGRRAVLRPWPSSAGAASCWASAPWRGSAAPPPS